MTRPVVALPFWLAVWYGVHLPAFYDWALRDTWPLNIEHGLLLLAGLVFWWPVFANEPHRVPTAIRLAYLGAAYIGSAFLSLAFIFSVRVFYAFYEDAPRLWGITATKDQNLGGILMNGEQMLVFFAALTLLPAAPAERGGRPAEGARGAMRRFLPASRSCAGPRASRAPRAPTATRRATCSRSSRCSCPTRRRSRARPRTGSRRRSPPPTTKGYKIRVAVIPFTGDLGTAVSLWRHPQLVLGVPREGDRVLLHGPDADRDAVGLRRSTTATGRSRRSCRR